MPDGEANTDTQTSGNAVKPVKNRTIILASVFAAAVAGITAGGFWATNDQRLIEGAQDGAVWKTEMASLAGIELPSTYGDAINHALDRGDVEMAQTLMDLAASEFPDRAHIFRESYFLFYQAIQNGQANAARYWLDQMPPEIFETSGDFIDTQLNAVMIEAAIHQNMPDIALSLIEQLEEGYEAFLKIVGMQHIDNSLIHPVFQSMDQDRLQRLSLDLYDILYTASTGENPLPVLAYSEERAQQLGQEFDDVFVRADIETYQERIGYLFDRIEATSPEFVFETMIGFYQTDGDKAHEFYQRFGGHLDLERLFAASLNEGNETALSWFMQTMPDHASELTVHAARQIAESLDNDNIDRAFYEQRLQRLAGLGVDLDLILAQHAFNPYFEQTLPVLVAYGANPQNALALTVENDDLGGFIVLSDNFGATYAFDNFASVYNAVDNGSVLILEEILRRDTESNGGMMIYNHGASLLTRAIYDRNERAANLLVEADAHYLLADWQRINVAEISAREGFPFVFETILNDMGLELTRAAQHTGTIYAPYYFMAAENGHIDIMRINLNEGVNVNIRTGEALRRAAQNGHLEAVEFLYSRGANPIFHQGEALFTAAYHNQYEVVEYLTRVNPRLLQMRDGGVISHAYAHQNRDMFDLLLVRGIQGFDHVMRKIFEDDNLAYAESVFAAFANDDRTLSRSVIAFMQSRASSEMLELFAQYGEENLTPPPANFHQDFIASRELQPIPYFDWTQIPDPEEENAFPQTPIIPDDPRP